MKVKDIIKKLENFNEEAELAFVISEHDGDNFTIDNIDFNPTDNNLITSNTKATYVELILSLTDNLQITIKDD